MTSMNELYMWESERSIQVIDLEEEDSEFSLSSIRFNTIYSVNIL